jgi:2-oxoglutarate dehydrogenase E2 component (dihydrolipoamide succinyltransferase)
VSQVEIKIPAVGESITEAVIEEWLKSSGEYVEKEEVIVTLETDKASVEITAESSGVLETKAAEGDTLEIGSVIGIIDSSKEKPAGAETKSTSSTADSSQKEDQTAQTHSSSSQGKAGPAAKHILEYKGLSESQVQGTGPKGNITKADAMAAKESVKPSAQAPAAEQSPKFEAPSFSSRESRREKMTTLRKRVAERLVSAQQTAAILTTFNEVDMTELMSLRSEYKEAFEEKYGVRLGFMGFFVKAVCEALKEFPAINASIDGDEIVYNDFVNMGIAVGGPKGLVVPVVKDADLKGIHHVEGEIKDYAKKAQSNKISIDDLTGGTFTISNGGVYGSLMSTPILNPPQSGILGMHAIQQRPHVVNGEIKIRPMMYLALSYDHRIVDGKESVSFLVKVKERLEDPRRLILGV